MAVATYGCSTCGACWWGSHPPPRLFNCPRCGEEYEYRPEEEKPVTREEEASIIAACERVLAQDDAAAQAED